jgi:hypothetical protein
MLHRAGKVEAASGFFTVAFTLIPSNALLLFTWPLSLFGQNFNAALIVKNASAAMEPPASPEEVEKRAQEVLRMRQQKADLPDAPEAMARASKKGACVIAVIGSFFLALGIGLLVGGHLMLEEISKIPPPDDVFKFLGPACNISRIEHEAMIKTWYTNCDGGTGGSGGACDSFDVCTDYYDYWFTLNTTGVGKEYSADIKWTVYESRSDTGIHREAHEREEGATCEETEQIEADYKVGSVMECWAPRDPAEQVNDAYHCSNEECIKVHDPAVEIKGLGQGANIMRIIGVVMVFIAGFFAWCYHRVKVNIAKMEKERAAGEISGVGVGNGGGAGFAGESEPMTEMVSRSQGAMI